MRRLIAVALMMTMCLTACRGADNEAEKEAIRKRTDLLSAGGCRLTAEVTADYGERVYEYTLECDYAYQGKSDIKVIKPEIVEGLSATMEYGNTMLSFDGLSIDTGILAEPELTPLGAVIMMADAWSAGYISGTCFEAADDIECLYVSYLVGYDNDELEYRTWFDKASLKPVKGEIISDGRAVIMIKYTDIY